MAYIHKELAQGQWQKLSLAEQIGNIGSELARAKFWHEKGNIENKKKSLERALELINLTLACIKEGTQLKEVARMQEVVANLFIESQRYLASFNDLERFYMPFALLARKNK